MENKNKILFFTTEGRADALAAVLARKNETLYFWTADGQAETYNEKGQYSGTIYAAKHADAITVLDSMSADELKNAHRIAAGRATIRAKEEKAAALLADLDTLTADGRAALLALVNIGYHSTGKIEGCYSIDGCASCEFCQKMIAAAACNPLVICRYCYAAADAWKEIAWRTHKLNARILSTVLFTKAELSGLQLGKRCRFNEDGDTVNEIHARNLLQIGLTHPGTSFGYWYKNAPAVEAGLRAEGIHGRADLPANIRFIHSSALIGIPVRACWFDDATFTVYPDKTRLAAALAAGAHECNGKRCRACGYFCYLHARRPEAVNIAEALRNCKPADLAAILAALEARGV